MTDNERALRASRGSVEIALELALQQLGADAATSAEAVFAARGLNIKTVKLILERLTKHN